MEVNDNETAAYQVGEMSSGNYRIFNFGFKGYGPHQMLSAIEHSLVEDIVLDHSLKKLSYINLSTII